MKRFAQLAWGAGLAAGLAAAIPEAPPAAGATAAPEAAPAAASATAAFDPYRVIIDRAIFGKPPARPGPAALRARRQLHQELLWMDPKPKKLTSRRPR